MYVHLELSYNIGTLAGALTLSASAEEATRRQVRRTRMTKQFRISALAAALLAGSVAIAAAQGGGGSSGGGSGAANQGDKAAGEHSRDSGGGSGEQKK